MAKKLSHGCIAFYDPLPADAVKMRVFCFYGSGQTAANLRRVPFPDGVERCIIEMPGRGLREDEELSDDMAELARETAEALEPLIVGSNQPPFAIFAYSLGSAIAFEFARAVRRAYDASPQTFYMSVRRPPGQPVEPLKLPDGSTKPVEELLSCSDEELLEAVAAYYGNPQLKSMLDSCREGSGESEEEMEKTRKYLHNQLAPVVRNDMSLGASASEVYWDPQYEREPKPNFEIVAFAAGDAHDVDSSAESVKGWAQVTDGQFTLHVIADATHEGILRHPDMFRTISEHMVR